MSPQTFLSSLALYLALAFPAQAVPVIKSAILSSFTAPYNPNTNALTGLAHDGSYTWALAGGRAYRITEAGTLAGSFATGLGQPSGMAWNGTSLWIADRATRRLWAFSGDGQKLGPSLDLDPLAGDYPADVGFGDGWFWGTKVVTGGNGGLFALDLSGTVARTREYPVVGSPLTVAVDPWDGSLWAGGYLTHGLDHLDRNGTLLERLTLESWARDMGGAAWNPSTRTLWVATNALPDMFYQLELRRDAPVTFSEPNITPQDGPPGTTFTWSVRVQPWTLPGGVKVFVDGIAHEMHLTAGADPVYLWSGPLDDPGAHVYHFDAEYEGRSRRFPDRGTLPGPVISGKLFTFSQSEDGWRKVDLSFCMEAWEYGTPPDDSMVYQGHDGQGMWATSFDGFYQPDANGRIQSPEFQVPGEAMLRVNVWYHVERGFDGFNLKAVVDGNAILVPYTYDLPYLDPGTCALSGEPAQSGSSAFAPVMLEASLARWADRNLALAVDFASDGDVTDWGVFLNDVQVVPEGTPLPPTPTPTITPTPGPPTATPTPSPTDASTATPTPTATPVVPPRIGLAGYWNTALSQEGGAFSILVLVLPGGNPLAEVGFAGDGEVPAIDAGNGVFGLMEVQVAGPIPAGRLLLQIQARSEDGMSSAAWPYLSVEP